jgi:hypothetical protein
MNLVERIARIFGLTSSQQPTGQPTSGLNGRWCVETSWPGKECSAWIPDSDENGAELTFATRAEANSYRYSVRKDGWVAQVNRWVPPPEPAERAPARSPSLVHQTRDGAMAAAKFWSKRYGEPVVPRETRPGEWRLVFDRPRPAPHYCPYCGSRPCGCTNFDRR